MYKLFSVIVKNQEEAVQVSKEFWQNELSYDLLINLRTKKLLFLKLIL
jgi:hypothetical protein